LGYFGSLDEISETLALNSEWQKNGNQTSDVDDNGVLKGNGWICGGGRKVDCW